MSKDNNRNTRKRCEICSKLTRKTTERCGVISLNVNISFSISINFEHVIAGCPTVLVDMGYNMLSKSHDLKTSSELISLN